MCETKCCEQTTDKCCNLGDIPLVTCNCAVFFLTGCSGELFLKDNDNDYEEIKLILPTCEDCDSHIALVLSSVDRKGNHEILNKFKNKKIRFTIEEVCD